MIRSPYVMSHGDDSNRDKARLWYSSDDSHTFPNRLHHPWWSRILQISSDCISGKSITVDGAEAAMTVLCLHPHCHHPSVRSELKR